MHISCIAPYHCDALTRLRACGHGYLRMKSIDAGGILATTSTLTSNDNIGAGRQ
jgi:hypothetical protein